MSFGGGGSPSQTAQQVALQTEQGISNANLNLEENEQRKTILNALQGTRVFRGSALSRNIAGDQPGATPATGAPSASQQSPKQVSVGASLIDPTTGREDGGFRNANTAGAIAAGTSSVSPGLNPQAYANAAGVR